MAGGKRRCAKCGRLLDEWLFAPEPRIASGRMAKCIECAKNDRKRWKEHTA